MNDTYEWINPTGKYLDKWSDYPNMEDGFRLFEWNMGICPENCYLIVDADNDGLTSASIIYQYMKLLNPLWKIKPLFHKGKKRGLDDEDIMNEILSNPRDFVIITDAGTNNTKQCEILKDNNIHTLIIDHHDITEENKYATIINNQMLDKDKNKDGSGCLVVHKFLQMLDEKLDKKYANQFIDLVALSLVSDSCSMISLENRTYVQFGLFKNKIKNKFLKILIDNYIKSDYFTLTDLSFNVIPKINAVCRSENQELKEKLFYAFCGEGDLEAVSKSCAQYHKQQTENVKTFVNNHKDDIDLSKKIILLLADDLPHAFSGLIAGKYSGMYNKPCIVGKPEKDKVIGSFRSPIPMRTILDNMEYIDWASGHEESCGIQIPLKTINELESQLQEIEFEDKNIEVLASFNPDEIPFYLFGKFDKYYNRFGKEVPTPKYHIYGIHINSSQINETRYEAKIYFELCGIKFEKKFVSKDIKQSFWHMDESVDLEIECIGELIISDYDGKNTVLMDKIEIKAEQI